MSANGALQTEPCAALKTARHTTRRCETSGFRKARHFPAGSCG